MRKLLLTFIISVSAIAAMAADYANESLRYRVEYKWGLVNKTAGYVTISLRNQGSKYNCNLYAATAPWADKIYKVRDTLHCEIQKQGFLPLIYEKKSHEGSERKLDIVRYSRAGGVTTGNCVRKAWKDGKIKRDETRVITATGTVVDMLSAFYYMRWLGYASWQPGHNHVLTVFSGKRKEVLTIKYRGIEEVKCNKKTYKAYHISFTFTSDDGKKTSDDMDAWICIQAPYIPVRLEGNLPVGKVRCFYEG